MLDNSEAEAARVAAELQDMRMYLEAEGDLESSLFLKTLQGMLHHTLLKDAGKLEGMYQQALNRICNQARLSPHAFIPHARHSGQILVAGSEWRLTEEGKNAELPDEEPSFSTWDDVMGKKGRASSGSQASTSAPVNSGAGVRDTTFYRLLEVAESASAAEIKAAYRAKALKVHPDVSSAPDATEKFAELSHAYDVLSDATARSLYDRFGPEGMKQQAGADSGRGNAREAWDEFKPYKKENKRTKARDAARASVSMDDADAQVADDGLPQFGDVVEYPLREIEMRELQDGRTAGVGLVVGRNMDRGDAKKLPPDQLDLCEIEPLRQEETGSERWFPDDLGIPSFARLGELRKLPVLDYDGRYDIWVINAPLSEGCGGPELPEEIML
ncbi:DnaJ-domain-containing protein [Coccomyxa subellipsoidea C-169]|uniref:DnaJ-domain-containing protein n=1 Tax=Coccomyxa subellipsoidea (strain C-169) TaxID=574566 RepID=I0YZT0_COCSC|nr:DnaJ-domain-containing protein [Coccomyxa subellipsoidea C-169]EIE23899.1 DnaJ-domain-containing protein [Coccomyxa subellipsoidea C-169]|eukprot:XP_005648443.1 DnaJ-domain-containing protein [Coccomyxa subellipsoidea C-169]